MQLIKDYDRESSFHEIVSDNACIDETVTKHCHDTDIQLFKEFENLLRIFKDLKN